MLSCSMIVFWRDMLYKRNFLPPYIVSFKCSISFATTCSPKQGFDIFDEGSFSRCPGRFVHCCVGNWRGSSSLGAGRSIRPSLAVAIVPSESVYSSVTVHRGLFKTALIQHDDKQRTSSATRLYLCCTISTTWSQLLRSAARPPASSSQRSL